MARMKLPQCSIRDLFWLVLAVALSCVWWLERRATVRDAFPLPSDSEVIQAWKRTGSTAPVLAEKQAKTLRITKHQIAEYSDPPSNGVATWHNHFKCTIHCETAGIEDVVYLDKVVSRPASSP